MDNKEYIDNPAQQLQHLSASKPILETEDIQKTPLLLFISRIVFVVLVCLLMVSAIIFPDDSSRYHIIHRAEAVLWLICGLSSPVILCIDPSKAMKLLSFVCIIVFAIDFLNDSAFSLSLFSPE